MTDTQQYDAIVIGAGQSGGPLSTDLVTSGRKTAIIERRYAGGTCINDGCTPTKTMVASARVAYLDARSPEYGVETANESIDMAAVLRRKNDIVLRFREGSRSAIVEGGADLIEGQACFTGPDSITVRLKAGGSVQLTAGEYFIDVGCRPNRPPLDGLDDVPFYDSTSILDLDEVPSHLLILGGGYIGLEFGQMFRRFGSEVTIIERGSSLLAREDPDICDAVAGIMQEDGVGVMLDSTVRRVSREGNGAICLDVERSGETQSLSGSHLLVAVGRRPNTDDLGADAAGVQLGRGGYIEVNERLETTAPGIWAMGDCAGSPAFTHISYDDFRIVRDNLLRGGHRTTADRLVPYTVFIDPQLGRVGLGETEARQRGKNIKVAKLPMSHVARALEVDEPRGLAKAIVDVDTEQILGAAVLGLEGGELMAMFEIAMMGKVRYPVLREGIFAHPTLAELMNRLFGTI